MSCNLYHDASDKLLFVAYSDRPTGAKFEPTILTIERNFSLGISVNTILSDRCSPEGFSRYFYIKKSLSSSHHGGIPKQYCDYDFSNGKLFHKSRDS